MSHDPQNILVIKLSALGDFFLALGAMEAIRRHHPQAKITLLTTRPFVDMAQKSGYFDVVETDSRPKTWQVFQWLKLKRWLNAQGFDRVYDLQLNDRTKLYYRLFNKKPEWSGVIAGNSLFYSNPSWRDMHAFERHREILKVAGIDMTLPDISWMVMDVSLFKLPKPYVLLIPGSAPQHPQKRWPAARYSALALRLAKEGYHVVALGTAAEKDVIAKICKAAPQIVDLSGQTSLFDIAGLARDAFAVVGNDTGPTHVAALAGAPVVALFSGHSKPEESAPVGDVRVLQADPIADLTVEDVFQQLPFGKKEAVL